MAEETFSWIVGLEVSKDLTKVKEIRHMYMLSGDLDIFIKGIIEKSEGLDNPYIEIDSEYIGITISGTRAISPAELEKVNKVLNLEKEKKKLAKDKQVEKEKAEYERLKAKFEKVKQ